MMINSLTMKLIAVLLLTILFSGCAEKTSENPVEVYQLWTGKKPSAYEKIIHGKYWQSAHWSREYIVYIEMKAPKEWVEKFVEQNELLPDTTDRQISDAPSWFNPSKDYLVFRRKDDIHSSRYYFNLKDDRIYIFEIQL